MNRFLAAAAFALVLALAPLASAQERAASTDEARPAAARVFIVGDSHVQMLGPLLTRQLRSDGFDVIGYEARPGWSSLRYQRAGDLAELLEANGSPEVVVVSLGGNDIPASRERYRAHLEWVVSQARAAGAQKIVWLGPATSDTDASERAAVVGARHEQNAEWQAELLPTLGVRWIDSRPCTNAHHGRDGIHFTRTGYDCWTHGVLPHVEATASAPMVATGDVA